MIKIQVVGREQVVSLYELRKLNILFAERIGSELKKLIQESHHDLVFDLSDIRFIDSTGFSMLKEVNETAKLYSSKFILCNVREEVYELLDLLELRNYFNTCKRDIKEKVLVEVE